MLNFKIIETSPNFPDVLLYRDRGNDDREYVEILAVGTIDGESNMFARDEMSFGNALLASAFIRCFDKKAAEEWCELEGITY